MLSGALSAATRWGWITVNPLDAAQRPRMPTPQPDPPSAEEAAKIANAAWEQDAGWGTFIWLTFITGARRGELVGLAWEHLDLISGFADHPAQPGPAQWQDDSQGHQNPPDAHWPFSYPS